MKMLAVCLVACLSVLLPSAAGEPVDYDYGFESDLYGMMVLRGKWHWSDRANLGWQVPASDTDGFAVYTEQGDGDTFFPLEVDTGFGLSYNIQYYVSSEVEGGTTFEVHLLKSNGELIEVLQSLSGTSHPDNTEWLQATGTVPATPDARLGVFCSTAGANPSTEGFMWGCAVDSLTIASNGGGDTTATAGPSDEPTATAGPSDEPPTTAHPHSPVVKFTFDHDNAGWCLGQSNGAVWLRTNHYVTNGNPPNHDYFLATFITDMQTGVITAMSPRMKVGDTGAMVVTATFLMTGTQEYPSSLKFRRSTSYDVFDPLPAMNLDPFGEQDNQHHWVNHTGSPLTNLQPGEEFNLIMESNLGIQGLLNKVAVSEIIVHGVELVPYEETTFFDFSNHLKGWMPGLVEGGHFVLKHYSEMIENFNMPPPTNGDHVLTLERYDVHSGIMSIESPQMLFHFGTVKTAHITFWMRGSRIFPTSLRIKLKNNENGKYQEYPFMDFTPWGNQPMTEWMGLESEFVLTNVNKTGYYQLAIEADLGADMNNMIAIDAITVSTQW